MITLEKMALQIIRDLDGGDISMDSRYNDKYVILRIRQKMVAKFKIERFHRINEGDGTAISNYIYSYIDQEVKSREGGGYPYVDIPDFYPSLPYNKGIHMICPSGDLFDPYIRKNFPAVTKNLKCGELQGKIGWWPEGQKVFFDKNKDVASKVTIKLLLPAPDAIGDTDNLPITADIQDEIITEIKAELAQMPIQDNISDNNPDIGVKING